MKETRQETYHLLGWSLGGKIALEIACILEQQGDRRIKIYLLDTILPDKYLVSIRSSCDMNKKQLLKDMISQGYNKSYAEKLILNADTEGRLGEQNISSVLSNTHILLFKAMLQDTTLATKGIIAMYKYLSTLRYNNVDKVVKNKTKLKLIEMPHAHHRNLLNQEDLLFSTIITG